MPPLNWYCPGGGHFVQARALEVPASLNLPGSVHLGPADLLGEVRACSLRFLWFLAYLATIGLGNCAYFVLAEELD